MTNIIFTEDEWTKALQGISDSYKVFAPVKDGDFHTFKPMNATKAPDFDFQNTRLSAKALIYPQSERMFEYSVDERASDASIVRETPKDYSPKAIVGIRPCDAHGFSIVRPNFDNQEYRDPWWVQSFESTVLVGLGCNQPCSTCFCASVGGGPFNKDVLDVLIYDLGANFMVTGLTEKGETFLTKVKGGKAADDESIKQAEALATEAAKMSKADVPTDKLRDKVINDLFAAPFWQDVGFACLNCGTCTYLCPTCWCFDIQDEVLGKQGDRIRNWDSCMFPLFTLHGSGHNPRDQKFQRVRQRFMHKLKYYVDKYQDGVQCSGCGRCVRYCPVNIDIRQVAELMNNY
ncbi:Heterodisulfide reductase, iron-sulfur binding subunit family protein [uncultured Desulfobacterium sp.]|uniref:Heterodisulfide reductase, iron-sulfur binding subunit family protein n=1 Tax=uncultured Desulfobacterium sp. TaxID=201089 RepID=A0A445N136_9BACT|nr:Heterodisulfide reductase, iron-sulfur binding subunit family protein [uncultured Desulfobacterium sp.]